MKVATIDYWLVGQRGGALETVVPRKTRLLFYEQTVNSLCAAVGQSARDADAFDSQRVRAHAENFRPEIFVRKLSALVAETRRV